VAAGQTNPRGPVTKPGKNSTVFDLLKRPRRSLSWPAAFRENQSPGVRGTPKQTCQFERLTTLRTRRHPPRKLQSVGRAGVPIKPVDQVLRRFFTHRSVELLLSGLVASSNSRTPIRVMFIPGFASHGIAGRQKQISLSESKPLSKAIPIVLVLAGITHSRRTHVRVIQIPDSRTFPDCCGQTAQSKKCPSRAWLRHFLEVNPAEGHRFVSKLVDFWSCRGVSFPSDGGDSDVLVDIPDRAVFLCRRTRRTITFS
jgi:hypothetical protein